MQERPIDNNYLDFINRLSDSLQSHGLTTAYIRTYGCQLNLSDSEKIKGILQSVGIEPTDNELEADIVVINTCAVRHTAETRVFGHIGRLKDRFTKHKDKLLMIGGCMVQQPHIVKQIAASYPFVGILFSTNNLSALPNLILTRLMTGRMTFDSYPDSYEIDESIPLSREKTYRALIPIMYGCNNYCTYCSVPFVRGPERSRNSRDISREFNLAIEDGFKEIMLLGQNVNSYRNNINDETNNFAELLNELCSNPSDYRVRFMTSHPKDAGIPLFETIGAHHQISRTIHLPLQSGSDNILSAMNRKYTSAKYLERINEARAIIPAVNFTSDIIIGFPGETEADFNATLELVRTVKFYSLFIFIYSKREGTKAALLEDDTPYQVKVRRLMELTEIQNEISLEYDRALIGSEQKAIATNQKDESQTELRLDNNSVITVDGLHRVGDFHIVIPTAIENRRLIGEIKQ